MSTSVRRTALLLATLTVGAASAQIRLPFQGGLTGKADYGSAIPMGNFTLLTPRLGDGRISLSHPVTLKSLQQLNVDINLESCKSNVALSPDGNLLALGYSDGYPDNFKDRVLIYDLKANKTILDFEGPCFGLVFLNNERLYTSKGVVLPRAGTQETPDLPDMEVYAKAGDYFLGSDGSIFSLKDKAFVVQKIGVPEGQPFGSLMLYRVSNEGEGRNHFRVVNIESGQIIEEFAQAKASPSDINYITLVDSGRVAAISDKEVYTFDLFSGQSKLYLRLLEGPWWNQFSTFYDAANRRLFTPGGQYINFK